MTPAVLQEKAQYLLERALAGQHAVGYYPFAPHWKPVIEWLEKKGYVTVCPAEDVQEGWGDLFGLAARARLGVVNRARWLSDRTWVQVTKTGIAAMTEVELMRTDPVTGELE